MESPDYSPPHLDASRPSVGFPLGTALLLLIIFSLSGVFSCCYHCDKLRSLRRSVSDDIDLESDGLGLGSSKAKVANSDLKQNQISCLPVIMPGDQVAKFVALPCPCEPRRPEKFVVRVQRPPKPPRFPVPLF